jgi:two-component SAPR family response regulator
VDNQDVILKLKDIDTATAPIQELRDLVKHLQDQMNNTYVYWVGEWNNAHRARSTRNGKFVSNDEVKRYLA